MKFLLIAPLLLMGFYWLGKPSPEGEPMLGIYPKRMAVANGSGTNLPSAIITYDGYGYAVSNLGPCRALSFGYESFHDTNGAAAPQKPPKYVEVRVGNRVGIWKEGVNGKVRNTLSVNLSEADALTWRKAD